MKPFFIHVFLVKSAFYLSVEFTAQIVRKHFIERFRKEPMVVRSPGRINLIGEHTDYNDGFVMPAAIDKGIVFAIAPAEDGITKVFAMN